MNTPHVKISFGVENITQSIHYSNLRHSVSLTLNTYSILHLHNDLHNFTWRSWVKQWRANCRGLQVFFLLFSFVSPSALPDMSWLMCFSFPFTKWTLCLAGQVCFQVTESEFIFGTIIVPLHIKMLSILECRINC